MIDKVFKNMYENAKVNMRSAALALIIGTIGNDRADISAHKVVCMSNGDTVKEVYNDTYTGMMISTAAGSTYSLECCPLRIIIAVADAVMNKYNN